MSDDNLIHFNIGDDLGEQAQANPASDPVPVGLTDREKPMLSFNLPKRKENKPIIKVVGVGGGGCNAVDHMYRSGIRDVLFVNCNTDMTSLNRSPVPIHIQLGKDGLGAGNIPENGRIAAEYSIEEIRQMFSDGTNMVFITAGMGGGTGTGAAPVIAREAKAMGILTIGIVTIPFLNEGTVKVNQALTGLEALSHEVDAMLVVNNQRLLEYYKDSDCLTAFDRADDTLCNATGSIVDIIASEGRINVDFNDVEMVLRNGKVAVISTAYAEGTGRLSKAISQALNSPLLNYDDVTRSRKILINVSFSQKEQPFMISEMAELMDFLKRFEERALWTKYGIVIDDTLGKKVKVTILTSGFGLDDAVTGVPEMKALDSDRREAIRHIYELQYGDCLKSGRHDFHTYVFTAQSLDNDDVIDKVASTPTYLRKAEALAQIKALEKRQP